MFRGSFLYNCRIERGEDGKTNDTFYSGGAQRHFISHIQHPDSGGGVAVGKEEPGAKERSEPSHRAVYVCLPPAAVRHGGAGLHNFGIPLAAHLGNSNGKNGRQHGKENVQQGDYQRVAQNTEKVA